MDKAEIHKYYAKIVDFYFLIKDKSKDNFGTISGWCRELDDSRHSTDKSLREFVKNLIDLGILRECGIDDQGKKIYHPTEDGIKICHIKMEMIQVDMGINRHYEVKRKRINIGENI